MPESESLQPEVSAAKSYLDKPLHELTEDDIAQLTREDCRRYLKEKGMRRPSWNKSQAIQQVIMLKTLLETTPDNTDGGSRKRLRVSLPNNSDNHNTTVPESVKVSKGTCGVTGNTISAEETAPYRRMDLKGFSGRFDAANEESAQPRTTGSTNMAAGQMAIFYCGKVNVYDDVPATKAQAIMHIAASPLEFAQDHPVDGTKILPHVSSPSQVVSTKSRPDSTVVLLPPLQAANTTNNSLGLEEERHRLHENPVECPSTRKASVQRYLEKRKDRFKSKRKAGMTACASLDVCINRQMSNQKPNRSHICSPTHIRPPSPLRCYSSAEDESVKSVSLPLL